ncbi:MAG: CBS domain-containing protein [Fimbriimonadaceae bacterium]
MVLREVLHAHIPTLTAASTVRDAVDKMDIYQFPALVVLNDDSEPIAVVTEGDLCRALDQVGTLVGIGAKPILDFATQGPTTANADSEVSDALHLMISSGLTILPVVDLEGMCGVVLRVDLMQAILMDAAQAATDAGAPGA